MADYDDGHTHEALHATFILMTAFEEHVAETECAKHFPDVADAADQIMAAMADLYQLIGSKRT